MLVDLHALIWAVENPDQLSAAARTTLQDAANQLVEVWKQIEELHRQLTGSGTSARRTAREQQVTLTGLRAKYLAAQVYAALARTEETLVSARAPSAEGRTRAKQLAEAALATAPDSPDAHYAMGDVWIDSSRPEAAARPRYGAQAAHGASQYGDGLTDAHYDK